MQLFIAAAGRSRVDHHALAAALGHAAAPVPHLALEDLLVERSPTGRTAVAAVAHPAATAAPRVYRAADARDLMLFDGLPVVPSGRFPGHDAGELLAHWDALPEALEGQFCLLRARLGHDRLEALSDPLGLYPLYTATTRDGTRLVANSVAAIVALTGERAPDPLGVSTFLTLGWAVADSTLVRGVRAVPGGTRLVVTPTGGDEHRHYTPAQTMRDASARPDSRDFVRDMQALMRAAVDEDLRPVRSPVTAGRDTRVLLALLRGTEAGADADYGTLGTEEETDVRIARLLARELGFPHRVVPPDPSGIAGDPVELIQTFLGLTDGLSSLQQLPDIGDLADPLPSLGIQLSGIGGELARTGGGAVKTLAPNLPGLRHLRAFQTRVLEAKIRQDGVATPASLGSARDYLRTFVTRRLAEGWKTTHLADAFFLYERVGRWGGTGVRRASARDDYFSPFCSRAFLDYGVRLSRAERLVDAAHYRLTSIEPRLRDLPFEHPWRPQRSGLAPFVLAGYAARTLLGRLRVTERLRARRGEPAAPERPPFAVEWVLAHRELHRELARSVPDSPLWAWIDPQALDAALAGESAGEAPDATLLRAVTLLWYFHGDRPAPGPLSPAHERGDRWEELEPLAVAA